MIISFGYLAEVNVYTSINNISCIYRGKSCTNMLIMLFHVDLSRSVWSAVNLAPASCEDEFNIWFIVIFYSVKVGFKMCANYLFWCMADFLKYNSIFICHHFRSFSKHGVEKFLLTLFENIKEIMECYSNNCATLGRIIAV